MALHGENVATQAVASGWAKCNWCVFCVTASLGILASRACSFRSKYDAYGSSSVKAFGIFNETLHF